MGKKSFIKFLAATLIKHLVTQLLHSDLELFLLQFLEPTSIVLLRFTPNLRITHYLHLPRNPMFEGSSLQLLRLLLLQQNSLPQNPDQFY